MSSWRPAAAPPPLGTDDLHVWRFPLDPRPDLAPLLSDDERDRAARFRFERDRDRFVAGRAILRLLLGGYLGVRPATVRLHLGAHGKPAVDGVAFNLSHSGDLALLAVTREREVGADLEAIRPEVAGEAIAERFFSPGEVAALRALPSADQSDAFFTLWTRKEAFLKALGSGLAAPLDGFDVSLDPHAPALLACRSDPDAPRRWRLLDLPAIAGYRSAVAVDDAARRLLVTPLAL